MLTPYISQQPVDDFGLPFASLKYSANLALTTDTVLTIPGNVKRYKALIKCSFAPAGNPSGVWIAIQPLGTAPIVAMQPAGALLEPSTSEFLSSIYPVCREVSAGDILHFFSPDADTAVSVVLYALNTNN